MGTGRVRWAARETKTRVRIPRYAARRRILSGYVIGIEDTVGNPHRLGYHRLGHGYSGRLRLAYCPSAVSWACLAVRREAFDEVGGFSEDHFTGVFGDVDLCLRIRQLSLDNS